MNKDMELGLDIMAKMAQWQASTFTESEEPVESLASRVALLESKYKELDTLVGEILATLMLGDNQEWFESLPESWYDNVQIWQERYQRLEDKDVAEDRGPSPLQECFESWVKMREIDLAGGLLVVSRKEWDE